MDLVQTFISTLCDSNDTFHFDWAESALQMTKFSDRLKKMKGYLKVYKTVNISQTHWVLLIFEGSRQLHTLSVSLFDNLASVTNGHQKVKAIVILFANAVGSCYQLLQLYSKKRCKKMTGLVGLGW